MSDVSQGSREPGNFQERSPIEKSIGQLLSNRLHMSPCYGYKVRYYTLLRERLKTWFEIQG
jgi:hypothetical protein